MQTIKVTIEEVISQVFEVEVTDMEHAYDEVREMYKMGELVVDDATLTCASVALHEYDEDVTDWLDLHV